MPKDHLPILLCIVHGGMIENKKAKTKQNIEIKQEAGNSRVSRLSHS